MVLTTAIVGHSGFDSRSDASAPGKVDIEGSVSATGRGVVVAGATPPAM